MKILTALSCTPDTATWSNSPGIRATVLDATNPVFLRNIRIGQSGVLMSHGALSVGITMADLIALFVANEPGLTWPPKITVQPESQSVATGDPTTFTLTATAEIAITYQWQDSPDGVTWTNLTNAGLFSGVTTDTLAISNVATLNGRHYRCIATNAAGDTNSTGAILTVT